MKANTYKILIFNYRNRNRVKIEKKRNMKKCIRVIFMSLFKFTVLLKIYVYFERKQN